MWLTKEQVDQQVIETIADSYKLTIEQATQMYEELQPVIIEKAARQWIKDNVGEQANG